jgi:acyl transferase domain-containing protein
MAKRFETASLEEFCFTAAAGRSHFEHRLAVVGTNRAEILSALSAHVTGDPNSRAIRAHAEGQAPRVVFVFPGQGSQWTGMGRQLLRWSNVFHRAIEQCDAAIAREAGWSLLQVLGSDAPGAPGGDRRRPADAVSLSVALAAVWRSWGGAHAVVGQEHG